MARATIRIVLTALLLVTAAGFATGCSGGTGAPDTAQRSKEMTPGEFPQNTPPAPEAPPPSMNRSPQSAVYSYMLWISFAYRILNSEVASPTFSVNEEVRVNSYVEYNKQEGRAIDQRLVDYKLGKVESKGDTATVAGRELWRYRYISTKTGNYKSEPMTVSYDTTYTVVKNDKGAWVVDLVEATPVGEAPK